MGLGQRIFLIGDDDTFQRLSLSKFERLYRQDSEECFPQYAGKRVRYALIVIEFEDRKPVEIVFAQYSYLFFDSEGRIDPTQREKEAKLAMDMIPSLKDERRNAQVIDARHKFAKKRFDDEYKWTPSPEIKRAIVNAIFGKQGN